jgi:quinol monooxygenase YgiN
MITLKGYIRIPKSDLEAVEEALHRHIMHTRDEEGCLKFIISGRKGEPTIYDVYESFVDKAALEAHRERTRSSHWGRVTKNVERFYTQE